jgi:hypothetical protein
LVAKNIEGCSQKTLHSYVACNQIWLNVEMDNCHFGQKKNITKLTKKTLEKVKRDRGALVCLFVCSFVRSLVVVAGGRVTVGEREGRMCLCSVVVVVATALLPILHQSTTQANLSFVVSNKNTTILL